MCNYKENLSCTFLVCVVGRAWKHVVDVVVFLKGTLVNVGSQIDDILKLHYLLHFGCRGKKIHLCFCLRLIFASLAADGDYWRLLNPGEYKVVVWAEGYFPSMRPCHVGMEPHPTICDFTLTKTPIQRLKEIRAKGGKIPQDLQLRLRALRLRKLRASTKVLNRRRESQRLQEEQVRRARSSDARRA